METIQSAFVPSEKGTNLVVTISTQRSIIRHSLIEISRAARILHGMERAQKMELRGAFGLELERGGKEMIDEPMVKQVRATSRPIGLLGMLRLHFVPRQKEL